MKEQNWVLIRDGEVRNVFENRKKAIAYFKKLLTQTLKDFKEQDKSDKFDYSIKIPELQIKPVGWENLFLGL